MTHLDKNAILAEGMRENLVHQRVPSLATGHEAAVWSLKRAKKRAHRRENALLDGLSGYLFGILSFMPL